MATNVQRGGFGFEKFFKRRSSSPKNPNELETNVNTRDDVANPSKETNDTESSKYDKFSGQKSDKSKYKSSDEREDNNDAFGRKTDESKKSSKTNKSAASERQGEKTKVSEACQELVIQDKVGQVKLAEIINNSIKEAVLNIVKEGVCPLADSLDRAKDVGKPASSSVNQGVLDKENAPGANAKYLPSFLPETNKTFDSHLCRGQYQPSNYSANYNKSSDHERVIANKYTRELCPYASKERKVKSTKQKDKNSQDTSPKITRVGKGGSHFRTDNRRMTGNVNIYICSEANDNTKDKKNEDKNKCNGDSETTSEAKTCTSSLSVSTSKLVAALRKKRRKDLDDQSLNCLCNFPENSAKAFDNVGTIGGDEDVLCPNYDEGGQDFLDTRSSSSRDCVCADQKFSNLDFAADSDLASSDHVCTSQDCEVPTGSASDQCSSYNHSDFWPYKIEDRTTYADDYRGKRFNQEQIIAEQNFVGCCSCCNLKRCQKDRPLSKVPCCWESRERNDRVQFTQCPCIVEEENEDCCIDKEEPEETFTVRGNSTGNEKSSNSDKLERATENTSTEFGSGILKSPTQSGMSKNDRIVHIASTSNEQIIGKNEKSNVMNDDTKTVAHKSSKTRLFSSFKRHNSTEREPTTVLETTTKVDEAKKSETKQVTEPDETFTNDSENGPVITNEKSKRSFFHRSIEKAMGMLKTEKVNAVNEGNEKMRVRSPQYLAKRKPNDTSGADNIDKESHELFRSEILNGKTMDINDKAKDTSDPSSKAKMTTNVNVKEKMNSIKLPISDDTSNPGKRSRSKICTAIATRRSSGATTTDTSNLSISQEPSPSKTFGSATTTIQQVITDCKFEKNSDNCACCKEPERPEEQSCKCNDKSGRVASNSCVCSKKMEIQKTSLCCPTCRNPIDFCICCKRKLETVVRDSCNCCPRCRRPISECKCCCVKQEKMVEEYCDFCHNLQPLCCCGKSSRGKRSHPMRCRQSSGCKDDYRQCELCCKAKTECKCNIKSMICIYCDNPQEDCTCRAPVQKCAQCGLPMDVCNCKPAEGCGCSGRVIVSTDTSNEQTMSVTAWKPRRSIRRYFARDGNGENFEEDCPCHDNTKPYGSDELPYQKRGVFSTVMSELQQKISGSICCDVCRKVPCCCCCKKNERIPKEKIERKPRNSRETERRIPYASQERCRSKSPARSCKCGPISQKKRGRKQAPKICKRCQSSPCQCRRNSGSPEMKPQAKCYYCKNSPCTCLPVNETTRARQFHSADSSHCRRTEFGLSEKRVNGENDNNGYQSRIVVPSSESQRNRKYCYRENSTKQYPLRSGERIE